MDWPAFPPLGVLDCIGGGRVNTPLRYPAVPGYACDMYPSCKSAGKLGQDRVDFKPATDEIAARAYALYLQHGSKPGHDILDWLEAEAQLQAELNCIPLGGDDSSSQV